MTLFEMAHYIIGDLPLEMSFIYGIAVMFFVFLIFSVIYAPFIFLVHLTKNK